MLILYITDSWMLCSVSWWCWSCLVHMINYFECDLWSANNFNVLRVVFSKQHILFNWKDAFSIVCVSPGSAEPLFRWDMKISSFIVKSLGNAFAKNYENQFMLARIIAKNVRDFFLRHSVLYMADLEDNLSEHEVSCCTYLRNCIYMSFSWRYMFCHSETRNLYQRSLTDWLTDFIEHSCSLMAE